MGASRHGNVDAARAAAVTPQVRDLKIRELQHRQRAILDQVFDELEERRKKGKGDLVSALADALLKDPLSGMERVARLFPQEQQPAILLNNVTMHLDALRAASQHQPLQLEGHSIIDVEAEEPW